MENTENSEFLESLQLFRDYIHEDRSEVTKSAIKATVATFEQAGVDFREFLHAFIYAIEDRVKPRSFSLLMEVVDLENDWMTEEEHDRQIALEQKEKQAIKQKKQRG